MELVKVKDHPHLVKDTNSKSLLNTNYAAYLEYKKRKDMEEEVKSLKEDLNDLKATLNTILTKMNK